MPKIALVFPATSDISIPIPSAPPRLSISIGTPAGWVLAMVAVTCVPSTTLTSTTSCALLSPTLLRYRHTAVPSLQVVELGAPEQLGPGPDRAETPEVTN